jgi:hypothetical protein
MDRFFHLKFKKWAFMKGFANFVPSTTRIPHWDALFKMYGPKGDLWSANYGNRFSLELNGWHGMSPVAKVEPLTYSIPGYPPAWDRSFVSDDGKYTVVIKALGFVPDAVQFKQNKIVDKSEVINGLALLDADRIAALDEFEKAKLEHRDILYIRDELVTFLTNAKEGVREDGTFGYIGWTPWIEALQQILAAHPVEHVTVAEYAYTPGRTIKGANIELHVGPEVYRTADWYWHGDKDSIDAKADPRTIGDYGGFTQCSEQEDYSFADFHFEVVKPGAYAPITATDE